MALVQNERTKLLANAVDRASTICLVIGIATPAVFNLYGRNEVSGWYGFAAFGLSLIGAIGLHLLAQRILRRLV
jgi:hypothetical protein